MAINKAVDGTVLDGLFTAIANAIRAKTGKSATMTPAEMPTEIASITDKVAGIFLDRSETVYSSNYAGKVPKYAFYMGSQSGVSGSALATLLLPNVTSAGDHAFDNCISLTTVDFSSLQNIGNYCFTNAFAANSEVSFPALTVASKDSFSYAKFKSISVPLLTDIPQNFCYSASYLKSMTFESDIKYIWSSAFYSCSALESVVFEGSITGDGSDVTGAIMANAFGYCSNCVLYDFRNCLTVPTLQNVNAFDRINANAQIVVPDALYNDWIAASNWTTYASYIVKASDYTPA